MLRDVLVDFYDQTKLDRQTLDPVDTVVDQAAYTLVLPAGKTIVQAHEVRVNNIQLEEMSEDHLDLQWSQLQASFSFSSRRDYSFGGLDDPTWRVATGTQPRAYYFEPNGDLRLVVIPETVYSGDRGIIARVSLKPIADSITTISDAHWNDYKDVIIAGVLNRLYLLPNESWTDDERAGVFGGQYIAGVNDAKAWVARSDNRNDREVMHSQCYS
jgi:hypothetical protein